MIVEVNEKTENNLAIMVIIGFVIMVILFILFGPSVASGSDLCMSLIVFPLVALLAAVL